MAVTSYGLPWGGRIHGSGPVVLLVGVCPSSRSSAYNSLQAGPLLRVLFSLHYSLLLSLSSAESPSTLFYSQ